MKNKITILCCILFISLGLGASFAITDGALVISTENKDDIIKDLIIAEVGEDNLDSITSLTIEKGVLTNKDLNWIDNLPSLKKLVITGQTSIERRFMKGYVFSFHETIEEVIIDSTTLDWYTIGVSSFRGCPNLRKVIMPNVAYIDHSSLVQNPNLTEVDLPNIVGIGGHTLSRNDSLTSLSLPKVQVLGNEALSRCPNLEYLNLPSLTGMVNLLELPKLETIELGEYPPYIRIAEDYINLPANKRPTITIPQTGLKWYLSEADGDITDNLWYGFIPLVRELDTTSVEVPSTVEVQ